MNYFLVEDDWITSLSRQLTDDSDETRLTVMLVLTAPATIQWSPNSAGMSELIPRDGPAPAVHTRKRVCLASRFNGAQ